MSRQISLDLPDTTRPSPDMLVRLARINADPNRPKRWVPTRLIVINWWYVAYQEFHLGGGRMVLNGKNGSGKSTIAAVSVPVALDMNKHKRRFDPFGGQERSPAYYLLGLPKATEQSSFYHEDRTGYVIWEFQHGVTGEVMTIGIGLRSKRADGEDPTMDAWGMVAPGMQIGEQFSLITTDGRGRDLPLTRQELKRVPGVQVFERNRDYQAAVNRLLFGFDNVDEYLTFTDTLFALRMPKLDRGVTPEMLSMSLQRALPSLSQDLVERLSSLIQGIDVAMAALADTTKHITRVEAIHTAQGHYANQLAQSAAITLQGNTRQLVAAQKKLGDTQSEIAATSIARLDIDSKIETCTHSLAAKQNALEVKQNSDAYKSVESLDVAQNDLRERNERVRTAQSAVTEADASGDALARKLEAVALEYHSDVADLEARAEAVMEEGAQARWPAVEVHVLAMRGALAQGSVTIAPEEEADPALLFNVHVLAADGDARQAQCRRIEQRITETELARRAFDEARQRLALATEQVAMADQGVAARTEGLEAAREVADNAITAWSQAAPHAVDHTTLTAALEALSLYTGPGVPQAVLAPLRREARTASETQAAAEQDALAEIAAAQHERRRLVAERVTVEQQQWVPPKARPGQLAARARLADAGIAAVPLYAACDFRDDIPAAQQVAIEAALEEAGLLDALLIRPADRARVAAFCDGTEAGDRWLVPPVRSGAASADPRPEGLATGARTAAAGDAGTLAEWLAPATTDLEHGDVLTLLAAITVGATGPARDGAMAHVTLSGAWQHGLMAGRPSHRTLTEPAFIGESNRLRRRALELARLSAAIDATDVVLVEVDERRRVARSAQAAIAGALVALADHVAFVALQDAAHALGAAKATLIHARERLATADTELGLRRQAARAADAEYEAALSGLESLRGLGRPEVQELRERTSRIVSEARAIERDLARLDRLRDRAVGYLADAETMREIARDRQEALAQALAARRGAEERITAIEAVLSGQDAASLRAEVGQLKVDLRALNAAHLEYREQRGKVVTRLETLEKLHTERTEVAVRLEGLCRSDELVLEQKLSAYREPALQRALVLFQTAGDGPLAAAQDLLRNRRSADEDLQGNVEQRLARIIGKLQQTYQAHSGDLAEYRPEMADNMATFVSPGDGQRVTPDRFLQRLRDIETDQRTAVSRAETDLYVNFFLNDVIAAVRHNVLRATGFVKVVNDVLTSMRFSNDAAFSFVWEPRSSHGRAGVDYTKLVNFVLLDPEAVTEEKRAAMLDEFRGRVDAVRQQADGAREGVYVERLAEEFDYRSWYTFRFFFQGPDGAAPEELRERGIEQLSGGERTLAQVLPLMAAVHARSLAARPDAPKLIAMDEAFAGVDHQNRTEILKAMVELEFAWVMTSDSLWGDSRVVPSCATYHLTAGKGVVLPTLYLWDGRRRLSESDVAGTTPGAPGTIRLRPTAVGLPALHEANVASVTAHTNGNGHPGLNGRASGPRNAGEE